jgi:hypothetical protein
MDVRVWTASAYMMADLSFGRSPIGVYPYNALAFYAHADKYMDTACIVIHPTWLLSIREWLAWLALEM